jgi:acyltransferase-like protein
MSSRTEQAAPHPPGAVGTAPPVHAAAAPQVSRLPFIDNLRILLICLVVVQHVSVTYGATGFWYYRDPATDAFTRTFLTLWDSVGQAAGMGFFFLIAGYFTPGPYDRKGAASFLRDRFIRLGIPLLLYDLLLDPLVAYIAGGLRGSYWSFYGGYLLQVRGVSGPVWFIAVLLLFSLLYAAWRLLTRNHPQAHGKPGNLPSTPAIEDDMLMPYRNAEFFSSTIPGTHLLSFQTGGHIVALIEEAVSTAVQQHIRDHAGEQDAQAPAPSPEAAAIREGS